jgi:hypothetical protein
MQLHRQACCTAYNLQRAASDADCDLEINFDLARVWHWNKAQSSPSIAAHNGQTRKHLHSMHGALGRKKDS